MIKKGDWKFPKGSLLIRRKSFAADNKGRRGKYIYVKGPGQKGKYYKEKAGYPLSYYAEYYIRGIISQGKGVSKRRVEYEQKLDKIAKRYPKVEDILGGGYAQYTIRNAQKLTPYGVINSYRNLLMNKDKVGDKLGVVRDKELLNIIVRPENVTKWRHRILYEVMLRNEKGQLMASILNGLPKTLPDIKREVLSKIKIGMDYGAFSKTIGTSDMTRLGYTINTGHSSQGRIKDVRIRMIFRKVKK